ncbi:MAG: ABC transporter permease [Deltaproteobacteria bacterium]
MRRGTRPRPTWIRRVGQGLVPCRSAIYRRSPRSPLWQLTLGRWRGFLREPSAVFWSFGFPLLLTLALGIAFRSHGPPKDAVAVEQGPDGERLAALLRPAFTVSLVSKEAGRAALGDGEVALLVSREGALSPVTFHFDPTRPEAQAARLRADDLLQRAAGRQDALVVVEDRVTAAGARYVDWLVPGLIGMQIMSGSIWGIAFVLVETRERKLLRRLVATPMRKAHFLLAFLLSRLVFVVVEVPVILIFAHIAFGVAVRGSAVAIGLVSVVGAASFAGLGILCGSRAQNTETANGLVNLATLPMFVLSGVFFSASRFPAILQGPINLLPLTALNEALRALVNQGSPLPSLALPLLVLVAWGALSFGLALRLFRWT